ncbi:MAG TPA: immunoglobulin domain-containing protein, partial [Candidatus Acidoferrum sp.]|nr:immunoglobulin domain-containing protein [Candidatus Acidoferrum sp.]
MRKILKGLVCAGTCAILSYTTSFISGCAGLVSGTSNNTSPTTLVVSNVQASAITTSGSQISWTTDALADSSVDYGTTAAFGNSTPVNSAMVTSHQVTLSGLAAGTTYYFQVNSTDTKGRHGHGGNSFKTGGFSLSGTISPATAGTGTTVTLTGPQSATTTPDSSGTYMFSGLAGGSYVVKPSNAGYTFNPASQTVTVGSGSVAGVNFSASSSTAAPAITTQPVNQTVTAGQTATFSVLATGTAPLSYQWQKNGANIAGATGTSYTTPATATTDSGSTFDVVVSNTAGSATSTTATLTVNAAPVAPTITTQPVNQTVTAGQTATFSVVASGTAPLSYQWQDNGANVTGATSSNYTTPATTTLQTGSKFDVVVTDPAGSVTSSAVTLTVSATVVAPTITTQPVSQTVTAGQTATFSVVASGTAPLNYQWQKNGANIAGATGTSYTTPATATTDSGSTFDVVVSNTAGSATSNAATLTVNAAPAPAIQVSSNSINFGNDVVGILTSL